MKKIQMIGVAFAIAGAGLAILSHKFEQAQTSQLFPARQPRDVITLKPHSSGKIIERLRQEEPPLRDNPTKTHDKLPLYIQYLHHLRQQ